MNWIKFVFSAVWGSIRGVLPDRVKTMIVSYFSKNQKILVLLEPAMSIVKTVALSYGAFNVVAARSHAIERMLESWGVISPPSTIKSVLDKGEQATVEEVKTALRDLSKLLMSASNKEFKTLKDSEQNLIIEMAYNMA
ncbi:MAG: hypothetical protein N3A54_03905, partial [Patescibacteria group bacterium]|nr:hypothetical protein [Patescibacteria group bacterium]